MKWLQRPFEGSELHILDAQPTQAKLDNFLEPRRILAAPLPPTMIDPIVNSTIVNLFSISNLKARLKFFMENPAFGMKKKNEVPRVVGAAIDVAQRL